VERDDRIDGHAPRHPTRQTAGRAVRICRTPRIGGVRRIGLLAVVGGLAVVAVGGLVGCGGEPAARTDRRAAAADATDATDPQSYVGRTTRAAIAEAEAAGVPWRITREDDEWFIVTMDFSPNRMNLEIDDGVVTRATLG